MRGALLALGLTLLTSQALAGEGHLHPVEVSFSTPDLRQGEQAVARLTLTIASGASSRDVPIESRVLASTKEQP